MTSEFRKEHKFKFWVIDKEQMFGPKSMFEVINSIHFNPLFEYNFLTLEYTEKTDIDGNEIYDGDVLFGPIYENGSSSNRKYYVVKYDCENYDDIWMYQPIDEKGDPYNYHYGGWSGSDFKIVGNIFENKEEFIDLLSAYNS